MSQYPMPYPQGAQFGLNPYQFNPQAHAQAFRSFQPQPQQPQRQQIQIDTFQVGSVDEARAAMVNPMGMTMFMNFPANEIYVKKIGNDGRSEFYTFSLVIPAQEAEKTQATNPLETINQRLERIELAIGGLAHVQSNGAAATGAGSVSDSTANDADVGHGKSEPANAPKSKRNAGGQDS